MTKFSIEFDSADKSLVVTRDGEILDSVRDVQVFQAYMDEDVEEILGPKFHIRITSQKEQDEVYETLMISASEISKNTFNSTIEEAVAKHYGVL